MSKGRAMRVLAMSGMGGEEEKSRYRGNEREMENYEPGRYMGGRAHNDGGRYERNSMRGRRDGMEDEDWPETGRGRRGRYMGMNGGEYDEDDRREGGGGWAGRFRSGKTQGKHEEDDDDEDEVEFDEEKAKKWVRGMQNGDGSAGEHFKAEHAEQLRTAHCPQCEKMEFWAALNMMYSDYCEVAKKMNVDRPEFYACMAKAFLMDKDAGEGKLAKYMKYVAGK